MRVSQHSVFCFHFLQCSLRSDLCIQSKSVAFLEFLEDSIVTPKSDMFCLCVLLFGMQLFLKFLCVCMQGVKSGSLEKPSSAEESPCCRLLKRLVFLLQPFQRKTFSCFFLHLCLSQQPLAIQHVGIAGQSIRQALSSTSSSKQSQQG